MKPFSFAVFLLGQFALIMAQPETDCKKTSLGKEYAGTLSTTKSGNTCQAWTSNTPQQHASNNPGTMDPKNFPEGNVEAAKNYCRNPDDTAGGPWCYTMNPSIRWEFCDVPLCGTGCKQTNLGKEYSGTLSTTKSGNNCQAWTADTPQQHASNNPGTMDPKNFPEGNVWAAKNYCRNPDDTDGGPWCYTMNPSKRWEFCDVPLCEIACKKTRLGKEYAGALNTTKSGKKCQAWTSSTPHEHASSNPATIDPKNFPEGSVEAAMNYCRNPDDTADGPWCYTMNKSTRWEYCDVEPCEIGCKKTKMGKEYTGTVSKTKSGDICQAWISNTPQEHAKSNPGTMDARNFPEGNVEAARNYCRNPDDTAGGPWCYTMNDKTRWEYCDVPPCVINCKRTKLGKDYAGTLSTTKSGNTCQAWTSNTPQEHSASNPATVNADNFPEVSVEAAKNYCRNPDDTADGPWCYTMNAKTRWEYCDVEPCDCKTTALGKEYSGTLNYTKSGKTCQAWTSQTPQEHASNNAPTMNPNNYPEGSLEAAKNYCRNPDDTSGGPWCYTTTANTRWEYCDVATCALD